MDAIGLGGIDIYLSVGGKQFVIGDGKRLAEAATRTPVVDGSGLKNTLERRVVQQLAARGLVTPDTQVLMVSALDRFGMAEAFVELGCPCVFGDLIFNIGLDFPLTTAGRDRRTGAKSTGRACSRCRSICCIRPARRRTRSRPTRATPSITRPRTSSPGTAI